MSFNFLYTSWVYRSCICLHIYLFKVCHQHCNGFENLISSWRVWISLSKLLWENVFLKNPAKSKVFQINWRPQAFFTKIWYQVGQLGYDSHGWPQVFLNLWGDPSAAARTSATEVCEACLIKLYAPNRCDRFFGIFQEYSMEYSIFQNFVYFSCFTFFAESYSKIFDIFVVAVFFCWKNPCSKYLRNIPKYSIFQKNQISLSLE